MLIVGHAESFPFMVAVLSLIKWLLELLVPTVVIVTVRGDDLTYLYVAFHLPYSFPSGFPLQGYQYVIPRRSLYPNPKP